LRQSSILTDIASDNLRAETHSQKVSAVRRLLYAQQQLEFCLQHIENYT